MNERRLADIYKGKNFSDIEGRDERTGTGERYKPKSNEDEEPTPVTQPKETPKTPRERAVEARDAAMKRMRETLYGNNENKDATDKERIEKIRKKMWEMDERGMQSTQEN